MKLAAGSVTPCSPGEADLHWQKPVAVAVLAKQHMGFDMPMTVGTQLAPARCMLGAEQGAGCTSPHPGMRVGP